MLYEIDIKRKDCVISLMGEWQNVDAFRISQELKAFLNKNEVNAIIFKTNELKKWDSSLLAVVYTLVNQNSSKKIEMDDLPKDIQRLIKLSMMDHRHPDNQQKRRLPFLESVGGYVLNLCESCSRGLDFLSDVWSSLKRYMKGQAVYRRVDFWTALEECAPKAVGIVSLISLMVGLILAFVGAIQLKSFGAQIYISSLVTIGMTRIMGAVMIGIIMAGRTGASYAASIGTMQVNEELDALKTMGISRVDFLVLPRLGALLSSMPFLVILSDFMGMLGGAAVGLIMFNLSPEEYYHFSVDAFHVKDFLIGIFHGIVFAWVISLCGCYFGLKCGRDSGSVGIATTKAVVYSIVWMIVMTGILTLICEALGI